MTPRKLFHPALDTRQQVVLSSSGLSSSTVTLVREPWKRRLDKQAGNTSRAVIRRRATVHSILAGGQ